MEMFYEMLRRLKTIKFPSEGVKNQTLNYVSGWANNVNLNELKQSDANQLLEVLVAFVVSMLTSR